MKKYLNSEKLNTKFSSQTIENTFALVQNNYSADKSQPYENYACVGVIRNSHIRKYGEKFILQRKDFSGTFASRLVKDVHPCNLREIPQTLLDEIKKDNNTCTVRNVPQQLLEDAANSNHTFTHVVIERRLFYNNKQETRIVIIPDQSQLGYGSNRSSLGKRGLAFLQGKEFFSLRRRALLQLHMLAQKFHVVAQILQMNVAFLKKSA